MKRPSFLLMLFASVAAIGLVPTAYAASACVDCHKNITPNIVSDWQLSKHGQAGFDCATCHGDGHTSASDVAKVQIPTPDTCAMCHPEKVTQYKAGKHAFAWASMKAMPTLHYQPAILSEGMKGCGGCHKIGVKTAAEIRDLKKNNPGFGTASCDACHTRHLFSVEEAKQPQACQTCHMGFDHPQWEMYSTSKHGTRYMLKQNKTLPASVSAPTCQSCHMQGGQHEVRTAWGFLAVRLPLPENIVQKEDRIAILQGLGVLDPTGKPTGRLDVVKGVQLARLTQEDWQKERDKMTKTCNQCHSSNFVKDELEKGDQLIADADHLVAEAIRVVAGLYRDGVLEKPKNYAYPFPDLLAFQDAPTSIEQRLFVMFLGHRNRTFQGMFHNNPDYTWWYGYSEMLQDLTSIKHMAQELRKEAKIATKAVSPAPPVVKKPAK
jgi:hypothetical protein